MLKIMGKKIFTIHAENFRLSKHVVPGMTYQYLVYTYFAHLSHRVKVSFCGPRMSVVNLLVHQQPPKSLDGYYQTSEE